MTLTPRGQGNNERLFEHLEKSGPAPKEGASKSAPVPRCRSHGILGFFLGAKWKYKQHEKKYAAVCKALLALQERINRLEAERAPRRELKKARKELEEKAQEKLEIEEKLEELKRDAR